MSQISQARALIDGDLLKHIERRIRQGYFEEWQSSNTVHDRETIFSKQAALEQVLFEIKEQAREVLKNVG